VIVGGKSVKRVSVLLKALVNLGSQMPVELHYWKDEVDEDKKRQFRDIHPRMYFNDLSAPENPLATVYDTSFGDRVHCKMAFGLLLS
jgi:alpha 1,2-mannosyltransferase